MILQKYDSYNDSEVDWIGEIPDGWEIKRVKEVCQVNKESLTDSVDPFLEINYVDISSVDTNYGIQQIEILNFGEAPSRARRIVKEGDVIVSTVRTYLKAIAFIEKNHDGHIVSTGFATITPNTKVVSKFIYRAAFSNYFIERIIANSVGVSYPAINSSFIRDNFLLLPPKQEQIKISDFLDEKTLKIDAQIKILQDKITNYEELRKSLIEKCVFKGLNDNVELKNSGFDWVGQIPKHWSIERNKNLFYESKVLSSTGEEDLLSVSEYTGVTVKEKDLETGENNSRADSLEGYKICKKGDLVINIMLAWKTGLGVSNYNGIVSPAYCVYSPKSKVHPFYFHYLFRTDIYTAEFRRHSTGIISSRLRLYSDKFFAIHTVLPPKEEQEKIANYLDEKTSKITKIIAKIKDQINTLKEFRKTLINDVVTGKVKV